MSRNEETEIYNEVIEWVNVNDAHFKRNCKPLYDEENLKRIRRFANTPIEYINERFELNKKVSEAYHKLHHSILLAGITGVFVILLSKSIIEFVKTLQFKYFVLLILTVIGLMIVKKIHLGYLVLRWSGLLRVIRDSEIEIYYLSKIKVNREKINPQTKVD